MGQTRRIAIIGGGIGGLSAAYYLQGRPSASGDQSYQCTLFEKAPRLGGNAASAYGETLFKPPFGDLGVNDFNIKTYTLMDKILGVLNTAAVGGERPFAVPVSNLLNTTCWYTPRGHAGKGVSYTDDDLADPSSPFLEHIARDWQRFATEGASLVLNNPARYRDMTVGAFVREQGYGREFAIYNLYARINGMYFMDDKHPAEMPILGVMSYYSLQEGMTGGVVPNPERKFFVNGASDWIYRLAAYLGWKGVQFRTDTDPIVDASSGHDVNIRYRASDREVTERFDAVIVAVHADQLGRVVQKGLPDGVARILSSFRYFSSVALWHDDDSVMPAERNHWRTYNIVIYPEDRCQLRPYTINYVCSMHQGRDRAEAPFVSESPLQGVCRDRLRGRVLPSESAPSGSAIAWFRHNMVSVEAMQAQCWLHAQQGCNNIYYTGGWTNGAGLHQEIMAVSLDIAKRLRGTYREEDANVALSHKPDHIPMYLRVAATERSETHGDMVPAGFVEEERVTSRVAY